MLISKFETSFTSKKKISILFHFDLRNKFHLYMSEYFVWFFSELTMEKKIKRLKSCYETREKDRQGRKGEKKKYNHNCKCFP